MSGEVKNVSEETATADQVAPEGDIDFDSAAADAERRLEGNDPIATPAEPAVEEPAAQPAVEEVKEPVAEPEKEETTEEATPGEPPEEPTDHKERTKLGREVARLKGDVSKLLEQNALLIERFTAPQAQPQPKAEPQEQEYIDISTPEGLDQFLSQRELQRAEAAQRDKVEYGSGYNAEVNSWNAKATESEDADATEIHKLLTGDTPFNVRYSSDPKADFQTNLSKAEASYYKQKAKTPVPERKAPLQNERPRAALSVGGESKADAPSGTSKPLKISAAAMEFAKAQGWSDEQVAQTLSAPVPNSFVRGRR